MSLSAWLLAPLVLIEGKAEDRGAIFGFIMFGLPVLRDGDPTAAAGGLIALY